MLAIKTYNRKFSVNPPKGFSLVELMIALLILAILVSFALPGYQDYLVRGKLTEATGGLAEYRILLEQYYQDNRNYGPASGNCGDTNNNSTLDSGEPALPTSNYFTFTCAVPGSNQSYTITAASNAGQGMGAAGAYTFTLDQVNNRQTTAFPGTTPPLPCWITKKGATC